ncbi:DUF6928 family protein [Nocardia thailandica]
MITKASTLWYSDVADPAALLRGHPEPDAAAAAALAAELYSDFDVRPITVGTLDGCSGPDRDEVFLGCYPGLTVVCTAEAALADPTRLPDLLVRPLASEHTFLVSFDTAWHWGAFAHWERGEFRRAFSSSRTDILSDEGLPMIWERPYWAGEHPLPWDEPPRPQSLPFDPPEFADAANEQWLGFRYLTAKGPDSPLPAQLRVCGFTLYPKGRAPAPEPAGVPGRASVPRRGRGLFARWRGADRVR